MDACTDTIKELERLSMPDCLEKRVISLLCFLKLKQLNMTHIQVRESTLILDDCIQQDVNYIKESLDKEELKRFKDMFEKISAGAFSAAESSLAKILEELRPFDVQELLRLLQRAEESIGGLRGQDIFLFLGQTGGGKSTTIHFISGSKMVRLLVNGVNHIAPTDIKNPLLQRVTTTNSSKSETRYITSVPVNLKDLCEYEDGVIVLCDTPGFGDTAGPEVDVANAISIIKAIKECNSVRPLVVIGYRSLGNRMENLKELIHVIAGMIPTIGNHIRSFTYLFTRFPDEERKQVHQMLVNYKNEQKVQEGSDEAFSAFFMDMLRQTRRGANVIDPVNDDPFDLIEEIRKAPPIRHPSEVFKFSITEKSASAIRDQMNKNQLNIISACERADYAFIEFKLKEMKQLDEIVQQEFIKNVLQDCMLFLIKKINVVYNSTVSIFNETLEKNIILSRKDIDRYKEGVQHMKQTELLRIHLGKNIPHSSALVQNIMDQSTGLLTALSSLELKDPAFKTRLDNLSLLSQNFEEITTLYMKAKQVGEDKLNMIAEGARKALARNNFDQFGAELNNLRDGLVSLHGHVDHLLQTTYQELVDSFTTHIQNSILEELPRLVEQPKLNVEKLQQSNATLTSAQESLLLQVHVNIQDIKFFVEQYCDAIQRAYDKLIAKINQMFSDESWSKAFANTKAVMEEVSILMNLSIMSSRLVKSYYGVIEFLCGHLQSARRGSEQELEKIQTPQNLDEAEEQTERRPITVDYNKLAQQLLVIRNAEWVDLYRPGVYQNSVSDIENLLLEHIDELRDMIDNLSFDLDDYDKIGRTSKLLEQFRKKHMSILLRSMANAREACEKILTSFTDKVKGTLEMIERMCDGNTSDSFYPQTAERQLKYVKCCVESPLLSTIAKNTMSSFEKYLRAYASDVERSIHTSFNFLVNEEDSVNNEMFTHATILSRRLGDLLELENKTNSTIFTYFDHRLRTNFVELFQNQWLKLSNEMEDLLAMGPQHVLRHKIKVAKYLAVVDKHMAGTSFDNLYIQYRDELRRQSQTAQQDIMGHIESHNYIQIATVLDQLKQGNDQQSVITYRHIQQTMLRFLNAYIDESKTKTIMLHGDLMTFQSQLSEVVDSLKKISAAQKYLSPYLADLQKELTMETEKIKRIISQHIGRYLNNIETLIESTDFAEADLQEKAMSNIRILLGQYCPTEIAESIEHLERKIADAFKKIVDEYSTMEIAQYRLKPPREIIEKLYSMKRSQVAEKIEDGVRTRFREEIERAKSSSNAISSLKRLEATLKSTLSQKLYDVLSGEFELAIEEVENQRTIFDDAIRIAIADDNVETIKTYLSEKANSRYSTQQTVVLPLLAKLREKKVELIEILTKKFDGEFSENSTGDVDLDIRKVWEGLRKLHQYKEKFEHDLPETKSIYDSVNSKLAELKTTLYNRVNNPNYSGNLISEKMIREIERSINILNTLVILTNTDQEFKGGAFSKAVFGLDFQLNMKDLYLKILKQFKKFQDQYEVGIMNKDITAINNSLNQLEIWNPIRAKVVERWRGSQEGIPLSYPEVVKNVTTFIKEFRDEIVSTDLLNDETKRNEKTRDTFYEQLSNKILMLKKVRDLRSHIHDSQEVDINSVEQQCVSALQKQVDFIFSTAQRIVEKKGELRRDEYDTFNHAYNNLLSFKKTLTPVINLEPGEAQIREKMNNRVGNALLNIENDIKKPDVVAEQLILLQEMSDNVFAFKDHISTHIDHALHSYRIRNDGATSIAQLGVLLNRDKRGIGQTLIAERNCFKGYSVSLFNSKTQHQDIEYVLKKIEGKGIDVHKEKLRSRYNEFNELYSMYVERYLDVKNEKIPELISNLKMELNKVLPHNRRRIEWDNTIKDSIPTIMAHIFALWTLKNSQHYFESKGVDNKDTYLLKPHAAQVVSIFRILGIGDSDDDKSSWFSKRKSKQSKKTIINNLVQIGTGEGKSVTLAVTASVLGLLGYDVMCACYSDYLSKRDYKDFSPIFESLGLFDHIFYGTFNSLCEKVINERGNVRELVEGIVQNTMNLKQASVSHRPKALLIDEVDVFFNKNFYGNDYVPSACLKDDAIVSLINMIWKERQRWQQVKGNKAFQEIKASTEYQECIKIFNGWEFLIEEAIKDMLADLNTFESHDYLVLHDRIGYKEQDGVSFNITFGYKTMFAYYYEHERGKITEKSLKENVAIGVSCGEFSYAEVPLEFDCIMGVTGTLKTLSDPEKAIVRDVYQIVKHTYAPSVFGENNRVFSRDRDIRIENEDDYSTALVNEIESRLQGKTQGTKRAVLVFFESRKKLNEFYESKSFGLYKDRALLITEELSALEKEAYIKRATTSGQVTLLTRVFGRGTDFVCRDQIVSANGGVHVIQTFLSEELSEETQIQGRTARQGDHGSYSMVLLDRELEKFLISDQDIQTMRNNRSYFNTLDKKRREYFIQQYSNNHTHVSVLKQKHQNTKNFVTNILKNNIQEVKKFLEERNKGTPLDNRSRTIVIMDATGSMSHLLHNAKTTVGSMFERAAEVLKDNGIASNVFELQFAVYRNYNAPQDELLQCSPWESKPANLRGFMDTIDPIYGWGNEAIEIGLWHANQESKIEDVSQVILIGDAAANSKDEIAYKRAGRGEPYWAKTKYATPTNLDRELQELKKQGIKVHAFYVLQSAETAFRGIASETGGRCEFLQIDSSSGAEMLTNLVTEEVLRNVGGAQKGNLLVEEYRKRYTS